MSIESERLRKRLYAKKRPPWAKWYTKPRWRRLRAYMLAQNPLCVACGGAAEILDHVQPHRGNEDLFYDPMNLQSMCKSCHDRKTAKYDSNFVKKKKNWSFGKCSTDGLPTDPAHPWNKK